MTDKISAAFADLRGEWADTVVTIKIKNPRATRSDDLTDAATRQRLVEEAERTVRADEVTLVARAMRRHRATPQPG